VDSTRQDVIVYLDSYYTKYQQNDPPNWGLDRIDEMLFGMGVDEEVSGFDGEYKFDQTGDGVLVFVVDTGIRADHDDFLDDDSYSRISCGFDSYHLHEHETGYQMGCFDGVGHGTHVAGIIGGSLYGVAKSVVMVSIKTFTVSGSGSVGSVMSGLEFIQRTKLLYPDEPMVANLSFGTPHFVKSLEEVIAGMVNAGVIVTVSAGNEGGDACAKWPAAFPNVITVGATTYQDEVAPYSNIGSCVDLVRFYKPVEFYRVITTSLVISPLFFDSTVRPRRSHYQCLERKEVRSCHHLGNLCRFRARCRRRRSRPGKVPCGDTGRDEEELADSFGNACRSRTPG